MHTGGIMHTFLQLPHVAGLPPLPAPPRPAPPPAHTRPAPCLPACSCPSGYNDNGALCGRPPHIYGEAWAHVGRPGQPVLTDTLAHAHPPTRTWVERVGAGPC